MRSPEIETERLILRRLSINDAETAYKNWCSNPSVARYTMWDVHKSVETTKNLFNMWEKEYEKESTFRWIVELKDTHDLIGTIDVASIQGFDKQVRNFTQVQTPKEAVMLLTKALIFGIAPTMLNDAMWDDDDEYEELQDYLKDNYYLFKGKDGQWIRIPKGRAMSVIGGAFRRAKNYAKGDKDAFKGFGEFAANQVAPNSVLNNNIFAPLSQVKNNKSWSGNKIISDSMAKRPTEEQYNEKTDKISIALGKAMKDLPLPESMKNFKSPLAIHYLLDQYTGVFGDVVLPIS